VLAFLGGSGAIEECFGPVQTTHGESGAVQVDEYVAQREQASGGGVPVAGFLIQVPGTKEKTRGGGEFASVNGDCGKVATVGSFRRTIATLTFQQNGSLQKFLSRLQVLNGQGIERRRSQFGRRQFSISEQSVAIGHLLQRRGSCRVAGFTQSGGQVVTNDSPQVVAGQNSSVCKQRVVDILRFGVASRADEESRELDARSWSVVRFRCRRPG